MTGRHLIEATFIYYNQWRFSASLIDVAEKVLKQRNLI